eukprot:359988-Chlamydomonas_euryale.AAC.3
MKNLLDVDTHDTYRVKQGVVDKGKGAYGAAEFIDLWAKHGGALDLLATTPETAGDMPGAELKVEEKKDFLSTAPVILEVCGEVRHYRKCGDGKKGRATFIHFPIPCLGTRSPSAAQTLSTFPQGCPHAPVVYFSLQPPSTLVGAPCWHTQAVSDDPPDEVQDDGNGQDSEDEDNVDAGDGNGEDEDADRITADGVAGPVGEGLLEDLGLSMHVAALIESGRVTSHFAGPSARQVRAFQRAAR